MLFAGWQLVMPPEFQSIRGLNPRAVVAWRSWFGAPWDPRAVAVDVYRTLFRTFIVIAWVAYAGLLWFVARGARLGTGWTWPVAIPLVAALAVAMPATLSTDVFAYVGYARMSVVHGLNPHLHTQAELIRLADPTTPYLRWPISSPYGPLWTLFSMAVVFAGRQISSAPSEAAAIVGPVIAFKLAAGLALLGAAAVAGAIARRTAPERATGVFVLVALNPLLLVEGPGNGHNDLVMMALLLTAIAAVGVGRLRRAALIVGTAAAVKLVPLIVVPWLTALEARARRGFRLPVAALTIALALSPVIVAYAPLWGGPRTLGGLVARWRSGDPAALKRSRPVRADGATSTATGESADGSLSAPGSTAALPGADATSAGAKPLWSFLRRLLYASPAFLIYLWATLAICIGQGDSAYRLAAVWSYVALGILAFAAGLWCSWYLAWVWPTLVLRFTRPHLMLAAFAVPFSLLLMLAYATPPG